jgi:hypothetical protein
MLGISLLRLWKRSPPTPSTTMHELIVNASNFGSLHSNGCELKSSVTPHRHCLTARMQQFRRIRHRYDNAITPAVGHFVLITLDTVNVLPTSVVLPPSGPSSDPITHGVLDGDPVPAHSLHIDLELIPRGGV